MHQYLDFDPFDNPMQLSKVGNWVITFLSPKDELSIVQLAITHVLPRQSTAPLQIRRVVIRNTANENRWKIEYLECFCGQANQEFVYTELDADLEKLLGQLIEDFSKYDVHVKHVSTDSEAV